MRCTVATRSFEGYWRGNVFEIRYVAEEAGAMDLHLWAENRRVEGVEEDEGVEDRKALSDGRVQARA